MKSLLNISEKILSSKSSSSPTIIINTSNINHSYKFWKIFQLFLIITSITLCKGTHYVKYHMSDYCDDTKIKQIKLQPFTNMTAIMIKLKRESYIPNMNCSINLIVPPNYGMMAFVTKLKMRRFNSRADYIEFITGGHSLIRFHGVNQETIPEKTILTSNEMMTIRFVSVPDYYSLPGKGFKIVVNLFTPTDYNNECNEQKGLTMNCQNKFCIDSILECDGIDNCRNDIDELQCDETSGTKLSLYVFSFTLLIICFVLIMFFAKSKNHRKEIVRRISEVYIHNHHPILYAIDNQSGTESPTNSNSCEENSSSSSSSSSFSNLNTNNSRINNDARKNNSLSIEPETPIRTMKSQLSFSLPHGIDRIHDNVI